LPLLVGESAIGVVALRFADAPRYLPPELAGLAQAMVRDLAQALARTRLVQQLQVARMQGETERLRAALLSSVSHDLRSPLSSIIGSAESLVVYRDNLSAEDQRALADGIVGEGQRLDRYIQNLLDMTRLGHGALTVEREWIGLDEVCGDVAPRFRKLYPAIPLQLHLPEAATLLHVHPALFEQALFNVLDNAGKFSPPGQPVTLTGMVVDDVLRIDIGDHGPGIPAEQRARIFDMFYSVERGDRGVQGTGLGLTICQGIIAAHGGTVQALAGKDDRGTTIRIDLPLSEPPSARPKDE
jgi:two-component system sensor histidine kinase KdpD